MENVKPEDLSLEQLLEKASTEAAYRPEFYKRLLDEALVVITIDSHIEDGERNLEEHSPVNIATFEDGKMPLFTSSDRIFDKGVVTEEVQILQLRGQSLFEMARGASFVLNPYSNFGKEILPDEVERMLDGTIFSDGGHTVTMQEEAQVLIGSLQIILRKWSMLSAHCIRANPMSMLHIWHGSTIPRLVQIHI